VLGDGEPPQRRAQEGGVGGVGRRGRRGRSDDDVPLDAADERVDGGRHGDEKRTCEGKVRSGSFSPGKKKKVGRRGARM